MNRFPLLRGFWQPKPAGKSICNKYHRAPCFWSGFWWLLIRDNPWMRWVNSGCFMDFLVLFLVILWILCLFRCLKHSALGKMPCATICCTCKKQLTARDSSWSQAYKKKSYRDSSASGWFSTTKNIFLTFRTTFLVGELLGNSSAFGPFLWRNYPEGRTQPEPWGNSGRLSPISQGTSRNNYESKKSHQWNFQTDHGYPNLH